MVETKVGCDFSLLTTMIDEFLKELGTSGMVDGDKARNQLLDLRSMCNRLEFESVVHEQK